MIINFVIFIFYFRFRIMPGKKEIVRLENHQREAVIIRMAEQKHLLFGKVKGGLISKSFST